MTYFANSSKGTTNSGGGSPSNSCLFDGLPYLYVLSANYNTGNSVRLWIDGTEHFPDNNGNVDQITGTFDFVTKWDDATDILLAKPYSDPQILPILLFLIHI